MAPLFSMPHHIQETDEDFTFVGVDASSEERSPQYKDCNVSSSEKGTCTAGNDLPGLTTAVDHAQTDEVKGIYGHSAKVQHSDFGESTTTGPTSSTLDNEDLDSPPFIPHPEPRPLTLAILNDNNDPGLVRDVAAWVNGEPSYWRPADDHASTLPLRDGTTRRSSDGSFGFVMAPLQPHDVAQEILGAGSSFDGAASHGTQLEFD